MRFFYSFFVLLLFSANTFASSMLESSWEILVNRAVVEGKRFTVQPGEEIRYLDMVDPKDETKPRQASYFSVRGYLASKDYFYPTDVTAVSENWLLVQESRWEIEQWLFRANKDTGALLSIYHRIIVKSLDGGTIKIVDLDAGNEEMRQAIWAQHLKKFSQQK